MEIFLFIRLLLFIIMFLFFLSAPLHFTLLNSHLIVRLYSSILLQNKHLIRSIIELVAKFILFISMTFDFQNKKTAKQKNELF